MKSALETGPRPLMMPPPRVAGRPFQARFWSAGEDTAPAVTGTLARNTVGAERTEFSVPGEEGLSVATIRLVEPNQLIFTVPEQRVILAKDSLDGPTLNFGAVFLDQRKLIEGYYCRLVKFASSADPTGESDRGELWWSDYLQIPLLDNPTGSKTVYRVFEIQQGEPPSDLFDLSGFTDEGYTRFFA